MDWEYIGAATGRFFLALLEYTFKGLAILSAGISLGSVSGFQHKFSVGFTSLTTAIRNVFELPSELIYQASIINDYNSMSASLFSNIYTNPNVDSVFAYFGGVLDYFSRVGDSLSGHFFASISAAVLLFSIFYVLAWVLRFARQKGQGSWKVQLDRKLAAKVFKVPEELAQVPQSQPAMEPQPKSKSPKVERKRSSKIHVNGKKMKMNGMKKNGEHSKTDPEPEKSNKPETTSKLRSVSRNNEAKDTSKTDINKSVTEKQQKKKSPPPPPERDEPNWLTNARKSTKEYRQAQASTS